ncbi:MAG: hypothetical protein IJ660_07545 [Alphaproteobacteria bacterium]|nr:hypothetical protein [Alphaproteobacteria bacterium]
MEKSYQLFDAGNKVVLRRLIEPDYEMRTVLVADELIPLYDAKGHNLSSVGENPFFVLKQKNLYVLCWERRKCIQVVADCEAYSLVEGNVLLKKEGCWYCWSKEADVSCLYPMGKQISVLGRLFIFKQGKSYLLNYLEGGELKTYTCSSYEILHADFQEHEEKEVELFPDILRISSEKGDLFVSVERTTEVIKIRRNKCYVHSYAFQLKEESSEELINFATYVRRFCYKMSGEDVKITDVDKYCDYAYIRQYTKEHSEFKISLNIDLKRNSITCVSVIANVSKLYQGADEAYQIYCAELDYYRSADDFWLEGNERERALYMTCDGRTDKISCSVKVLMEEQYLTLSENV